MPTSGAARAKRWDRGTDIGVGNGQGTGGISPETKFGKIFFLAKITYNSGILLIFMHVFIFSDKKCLAPFKVDWPPTPMGPDLFESSFYNWSI